MTDLFDSLYDHDSGPIVDAIVAEAFGFFEPPPLLLLSEYADENRILSRESSAEPGRWRTDRTPYMRDIMNSFNDPAVHEIVFMSSAQVGKTELELNIILYFGGAEPTSILMVQPTVDMAKEFSRQRLGPMIRDCPALGGMAEAGPRGDGADTLMTKTIPGGGYVALAGANSPAGLASRPIRVVLLDEVDRYPASAGAEGDPVKLATKRTRTFSNRKIVMVSTPTIKGSSRIEAAYEETDRRQFWVPCPHCGTEQVLEWKNVQWPEGKPEAALYHCPDCGAGWQEHEKQLAIRAGRWIARDGFTGRAGFHLNELYSPWSTAADMAIAFLEAKRAGPDKLKTWVNTSLGETWEDIGERIDNEEVGGRREEYEGAPADVIVVTTGVDVQADRLELGIFGHGLDDEMWGLDHKIIHGDPSGDSVWRELDAILQTPVKHEAFGSLPISAVAIDSGYLSQKVLGFTRPRWGRRVWAVKGVQEPTRAIWPRKPTKAKGGAPLFIVGITDAKNTIFARLQNANPGPGYIHWNGAFSDSWFTQLTAEERIEKWSRGIKSYVWELKQGHKRNEALDITVYAIAAFEGLRMMGLDLIGRSVSLWRSADLKAATGPPPDPDDPAPAAASAPAPPEPVAERLSRPRRRRRKPAARSSILS